MAFGVHNGIFLSGFVPSLRVQLNFVRNVPTVNATTGEEEYNPTPVAVVPASQVFLWVTSDRGLSTKGQQQYAWTYNAIISGSHDIKHHDRCMVDGAECVVEAVEDYQAHMEVTLGAVQPGDA